MSKQQLLELAERVEALNGPCREVDAEICALFRLAPNGVGSVWLASLKANSPELGRVECCTNLGTGGPHFASPKFTESLDAAMKLVPEGWGWMAGNRDQPKARAYVNNGELAFVGVGSRRNKSQRWFEVVGHTPALALTAASLRAKAAMIEGGE